ncbi:MAG: NAD(P)/FAD-dependent oxidoreductase [Ectothiorhodospiraceae bacterium]|nr:NAD(P)/FAD-dependent oxidoreductase [Ectothiorhodospiraceae bacterium]
MDRVDCVVIGAGVVGLAVARALALRGREVIIVERAEVIGSEVSSRNSCVIHAGIYYAPGSIKARVCVAGKHALYDFCATHGVDHARVGKLIVATEETQLAALDKLRAQAAANAVDDLIRLDRAEARALEPEVECIGALLSPSTGIIDVHEYMLALQGDAEAHGAVLALASPCLGGEIRDDGIRLDIGGAEPMSLLCDTVVNAAALGAMDVARALRGLDERCIPPLYYAKGNYFYLTGRSPFNRLVYPMPSGAWLGVHVSLDLGGRCRFGPDIHWVETLDYDVDPSQLEAFYGSIRRYYPGLRDGALMPDYTGIRPKLTASGEPARDFLIQTSAEHGVDGLVNLFGIESPGLTSSLAIGEEVADVLCGSASAPAGRSA